jgi:hypothetical protein
LNSGTIARIAAIELPSAVAFLSINANLVYDLSSVEEARARTNEAEVDDLSGSAGAKTASWSVKRTR